MAKLNSPNTNSKRDPIITSTTGSTAAKNTSAGRIMSTTGPKIPNSKGDPLAPDSGLRVI